MFWTLIFGISIAQAIFLISLIIIRGSKNRNASNMICGMLVLMLMTNLGYLVIRTEMLYIAPQLFGVPFGMIFLFGPLFYFYSRSVIDHKFHWRLIYILHFIPYLLYMISMLPFLFAGKQVWFDFISVFLAGNLPIHGFEKIMFAVQDLHLLAYLIFTIRWIRSAQNFYGNPQYMISVAARVKWLSALSYCFLLFLITVSGLYIFIIVQGKYKPVTNYLYTLVSSGIIYFIAYKLVLNPGLISPDFIQKYKAYMQFIGEDGDKYVQKLGLLMENDKIFTDPELTLAILAEKMPLPSHQLSKLINEKFGKSFNDYVSEYRVREFILMVNQEQYKSYTIFGIAMEAGFNSKSSFNNAFKKITGKTPSDYRS